MDFFALAFFAVGFLTLPTFATFLRGAVVSISVLADSLGDVPRVCLDVSLAVIDPPRI